jgi:threonine dehydrogenase-like Zn-dependent dehydrogenase
VIGVDLVPERLQAARAYGAEVLDLSQEDDVADRLREMTDGRGPDGVLDAVGMEAHGNPLASVAIKAASRLPGPVARSAIETAGIDRLAALHTAFRAVRRGGTVSISGVYGGMADPMPMMEMFDKGLRLRMGQCHVKQWTPELHEVLSQSADVLGVESLATHRVPLSEAADAYAMFQAKQDGCIKVVLQP